VALLTAVAVSAVLSALVGLATLRLSGMYFVIFTFGLASLVSAAVSWWEFNVARQAGWYLFLPITTTHIYYQLLALCVATIGLWLLRDRSRMGFALRTLGADETVARQVGINTVALKVGTFVVSALVMTLAGAILAPRRSYMDAGNAFNPEISFLTVIMALLGGANSVWGPVLGVVPLVLIQDYLSIAWASHFSVLLGLALLGVVFFVPNGLIGLLQAAWGSVRGHSLADILEAWAARLRGRSVRAQRRPPGLRARQTGTPAAHEERKAQR
jgi:branched-chain amino acid transport system permease protein